MRISDWSSDVCSSDLDVADLGAVEAAHAGWDGLCGHDVFRWVEPTLPTAVSWRFRIVPGVGGVAPTYAFNRVARAAPPRPQRVPAWRRNPAWRAPAPASRGSPDMPKNGNPGHGRHRLTQQGNNGERKNNRLDPQYLYATRKTAF